MTQISRLGKRDDWVHTEEVEAPKAGEPRHTITPESGKVVISYVDDDGNTLYWNGAQFAGSYVELATTINGTQSIYQYTHQEETRNRTVTFEGWIVRGGTKTPTRRVAVWVEPVDHVGYYVD